MKTPYILCSGLIVLGLLALSGIAAAQEDTTSGTLLTDTIQPYNGPIGPDSPLYGLKLTFEDMDESFTADQTRKIDLQVEHAEIRIAEAKEELAGGRDDMAQEALDRYWQKMNLTNASITNWTGNATGLLHAQEMIAKHQFVLEQLLQSHPGNPGLMEAYNNSQTLEEKFADRTAFWFNRTTGESNRTFLRPEYRGDEGKGHQGWPGPNETVTRTFLNQTPPDGHHGLPGMNGTANWTLSNQTPPDHQNQNGRHQDQQQGGGGSQQGNQGNPQGGGQQIGNNNGEGGRGGYRTR